MGIKNLNTFLRDICPDIFVPCHLSQFAYKKIAIDISLYMHKYKAVCGDRWLSAFINLISSLRRNELHCVFIFDGKAPIEKDREHVKRKESREKQESKCNQLEEALDLYNQNSTISQCLLDLSKRRRSPPSYHKRLLSKSNKSSSKDIDIEWLTNKLEQLRNQLYKITSEDFELVKTLFSILNVPFYTAPHEAEKFCAKLCIDGMVDAVLSEDTDIIAYGSPVFLSKIDTSAATCVSIQNSRVLEELKLDKNQFVDFCIMLGTDYNDNIPKVGNKTAYKYMLKYGGIDELSKESKIDISILNHIRVRELFTDFTEEVQVINTMNIPYCFSPNFEKLEKFVIKQKISINIEKLRQDFTQNNLIVFEDSDENSDEESKDEIILDDDEEIILDDEEIILENDEIY